MVGDAGGHKLAGFFVAQRIDAVQQSVDHGLARGVETARAVVDGFGLRVVLESEREWEEDAVPEKENKQLP